jgi:hypothetical protein
MTAAINLNDPQTALQPLGARAVEIRGRSAWTSAATGDGELSDENKGLVDWALSFADCCRT